MTQRQPIRILRTRNRHNVTPAGAVYVGRPTDFGNPFERRPRIGHARSVILYEAWLQGEVTPHILACAGFGEDELAGLARMRERLLARMPELKGRDLQCWCPISSAWCHAGILLRVANPEPMRAAATFRLAA